MTLVLHVSPREPDPAGMRADAEQQGGEAGPRHPRPSRRACSQSAACAPPLSAGLPRQIRIMLPLTAALMVGGAVLIGQAVWIHAKALLAQVLLERAFAATLATGKGRQAMVMGPY